MTRTNKFFIFIFLAFSVFLIGIISVGKITYEYFLPTIIHKEALVNHNDRGITLYDDQGKEFFSFFDANNKKYIPFASISDNVKKAAVAAEDNEFYQHNGFSIKGILRSIVKNVSSRSVSYGGSTITQQLVKNTLLSPDRSFIRKYKEIVLAIEIEQYYTKDQILEMYLNTSYFGDNSFGIEAASENYFGKSARDLNVNEASYLVALLPSPTKFSENLKLARLQQKLVLERMLETGKISPHTELITEVTPLNFKEQLMYKNNTATHFALYVRDLLINKFGERNVIRSGFKVKTTLSVDLQKKAEEAVNKQINSIESQGAGNAAVVAMDPHTGDVKAMVGSRDWNNNVFGKVNMAIVPRQPGSSFKPIIYGIAFENGLITPSTILQDMPSSFKIPGCRVNCYYSPHDYDGNYRGDVTVRRALSNSLNIPAVEVEQKIGVEKVLEKVPLLGIKNMGKDPLRYGPSIALGAGEVSLLSMTNVYATFANEGKSVTPKVISEIEDKNGDKFNFYDNSSIHQDPWSADVAYLISSILSDNNARKEIFGDLLNIPRPAAVKTGTSETYKDAWTIGYTPDLVVGVWVGNNDMRPMDVIAGSIGAAPIWKDIMEYFHRGLAIKNFEPPSGIVKIASSCSFDVNDASNSARINYEYYIAGTEPSGRTECPQVPSDVAIATPSANFESDFSLNNQEFQSSSSGNIIIYENQQIEIPRELTRRIKDKMKGIGGGPE